MRRRALLLLLLAGCSQQAAPPVPNAAAAASGLEAAAISAGVIPDPANTDMTGLYARETDRVCVVPTPSAYRLGVVVDYADEQGCSGTATATRAGEQVYLEFAGVADCAFDARFEGNRMVFPGRVPDGCQALCTKRASLAGLQVDRLSESRSEASTLRNAKGRLLCDGG